VVSQRPRRGGTTSSGDGRATGAASANYLETFPYFGLLALAVHFSGASSTTSTWGVALYLLGRLLYLPLYAFGVMLVRSLAWNVATLGIVLLGYALVTSVAHLGQ